MKIKDILDMEKTNLSSITLLKEGMFYRAYNRSAMRMSTKVRALKVNTKLIKYVGQTVMYCGFPDSILPGIRNLCAQKNYAWNARGETRIDIEGVVGPDEDYEGWVRKILKGSVVTDEPGEREMNPSVVFSDDQVEVLKTMNVRLEQLRYLVRFAKDMKHISNEQYDYFVMKVIEIGRMMKF